MLCQFIFKNFKSYRDETIFDLQATSIKEFFESLLHNEKDVKSANFLPLSAIYGPNAGGKSGVLEALNCLISNVMGPIEYINKKKYSITTQRDFECVPFLYSEFSQKEPTEFTVFFQEGKYEFRYTLAISKDGIFSESLYKRNLSAKNPAKIFVRDLNKIEHGQYLCKIPINKEISNELPYLSYLAITYKNNLIRTAVKWFENCIFINYANPSTLAEIQLFPSEKEKLIKMLNDIDIFISDYEIITHKNEKNDRLYIIKEYEGEKYGLDIFYESGGTRKLMGLLPKILIALRDGRLLVIDELDASLHSKLLKYIIMLFSNKEINRNNAQLLFTSHDIAVMKNDIFRRDEIWFAAKDETGASEIYSLCEIRDENDSPIRANAAFDKRYLEGRYGADPYLSVMTSLKWED